MHCIDGIRGGESFSPPPKMLTENAGNGSAGVRRGTDCGPLFLRSSSKLRHGHQAVLTATYTPSPSHRRSHDVEIPRAEGFNVPDRHRAASVRTYQPRSVETVQKVPRFAKAAPPGTRFGGSEIGDNKIDPPFPTCPTSSPCFNTGRSSPQPTTPPESRFRDCRRRHQWRRKTDLVVGQAKWRHGPAMLNNAAGTGVFCRSCRAVAGTVADVALTDGS